ncbi:MAG: FAD binding domain-containing protein, partial [Chloroflexota bacterium]
MRRFAYERPGSLAEATRVLWEADDEAMVLAGGTDLVVGLRDESLRPRVVVDLKRVLDLSGPTIVR